jgi:hypothetical protein
MLILSYTQGWIAKGEITKEDYEEMGRLLES